MSVIAGVKVERISGKFGFDLGPGWKAVIDEVRAAFGDEAWKWYHAHENDQVVVIKKFFVSFTVRIHHFHLIMVTLFGEEPKAL